MARSRSYFANVNRIASAFAVAASIAVAGCEVTTQSCLEQGVGLRFPGFTQAELNSVIIRQYSAGSDFQVQLRVDSVTIDSTVLSQKYGTAFPTYAPPEPGYILRSGVDYEVFVPATGSLTRISDITSEGQLQVSDRHHRLTIVDLECVNGVRLFIQDGKPSLLGEQAEYNGVWADVPR